MLCFAALPRWFWLGVPSEDPLAAGELKNKPLLAAGLAVPETERPSKFFLGEHLNEAS